MSEHQIDWEKIIHKVVHSTDNQDVGNVISIGEYRVTIGSHDAKTEYSIPKSSVEGFNGSEVFLNVSLPEITTFDTIHSACGCRIVNGRCCCPPST